MGHHPPHPHELQRPAREGEYVARAEPGDEVFLDRADGAAAENCTFMADSLTMVPIDSRWRMAAIAAGHHVAPIPLDHLAVLGVRLERVAAAGDEVEHPAPLVVAAGRDRPSVVRTSASSSSARKPPPSAMVTACWASRSSGRSTGRRASISPASSAARAAATSTSSSALVGTQVSRLTAPGWWPLRPGPLDQAAHRLRAADLEHPVHRGEVHAEVEGRGADHAAEPALAEAVLHPLAGGSIHRAVVQRHNAGPVGPRGEQGLEPELRGGAGVGEDQRGLALLDRPDDLGQKPEADLPRPGKPLHRLGDQRIHLERLGDETLEDPAGRGAPVGVHPQQRIPRGVEVAQRGGEAQGAEPGPETAEPRQAELGLHPPLRRHQLVPLVHHHQLRGARRACGASSRVSRSDRLSGVVTSAVGRRSRWRARTRAGVSPVRDSTRPGKAEVFDRRAKRILGVGRERAERSDPEDGERRGRLAAARRDSRAATPAPGPSMRRRSCPVPVAAWISPLSPARYARQTSC